MADIELKSRFGLVEAVRWRTMRGGTVFLPWPDEKEVTVDHNDEVWADLGGAVYVKAVTDCPNWHYRPYIRKNIGKHGKDWMWRVHPGRFIPGTGVPVVSPYYLELRLSKKNAKWATLLRLKWCSQ